MDLNDFRRLFTYNHWANCEVLDGMRLAEKSCPRSLRLMAHVLAAELLWLERIEQREQSLPVWPDFSMAECATWSAEMAARWEKFVDEMDDAGLATTVTYKNSKGESWTSRKDDILMHVIMHSAYHRGQIASDMRAEELTPAYTDFIHAVRQGFVE